MFSSPSLFQLASEIGVRPDELELYGRSKAKVSLDVIDRLADRKNGKYVVVVGMLRTVAAFD